MCDTILISLMQNCSFLDLEVPRQINTEKACVKDVIQVSYFCFCDGYDYKCGICDGYDFCLTKAAKVFSKFVGVTDLK